MKKLILYAFLFLTFPAHAQQNNLCQKLATHVSDANVAFQPGVDVRGKPVVGANVGAPQALIAVPDTIEIPLTVDLADRLGVPVPQGVQMEALIGFLQITKDGRVLQNGQDLTDQAVYLCKDSAKNDVSKDHSHEPTSSPKTPHSHQPNAR